MALSRHSRYRGSPHDLLKIARFRNGPLGVKSLVSTSRILGAPRERAHHSAVASAAPAMRFPLLSPVSCFRPWSAQSRHTMPSEETANLSKDARSESRPLACTRLRWLHRPGDGTSGGATLWRSEFGFFSSMRRDARAQLRFRPSEIRPVDPHTLQNHADLARCESRSNNPSLKRPLLFKRP
jgi:hypothetical protein